MAAHGLIWIVSSTKAYWSTQRAAAIFLSPDGEFKAAVFLSMGGGPGSSYCGTSVHVGRAADTDTDIGGQSSLVYSAPCGGMAEGHWERNISWKSSRVLEIDFDPTAGAAGGELAIRGFAGRGQVRVHFGFRQGGDSW